MKGLGMRDGRMGRINLPSNNSDPGHTVLTRFECGVGPITLHLSLFLYREIKTLDA